MKLNAQAQLVWDAAASCGPLIAQALGTGPTVEFDAMPACFAELTHSARAELVATTPYFVPDEQLLFALTPAGRRGVRTISPDAALVQSLLHQAF